MVSILRPRAVRVIGGCCIPGEWGQGLGDIDSGPMALTTSMRGIYRIAGGDFMNPDLMRRVLLELSEALPAEGHNVLTGIDMRTGWADIIFVTVRSAMSPLHGRDDVGNRYKMAVAAALGAARHHIEVKWDHRQLLPPWCRYGTTSPGIAVLR